MKFSLARPGMLAAALALAASGGIVAVASPAHAASTTPVNIIGTSDVSDSNLMQAVIKPGFEAAYPQYQLNYTGKATGAAITGAEQGGYDGLVVHAASLENQFVGGGFSQEPYGRAIFWGDFVLAGPASDPAGVLNGSNHDIVRAFEKIAAAGAAGKATFISRGGTPGTTVSEHAIWQDVAADTAKAADPGPLCQVRTQDGGGLTPAASTSASDCPMDDPSGSTVGSIKPPSWYAVTGATQGPNVVDADQCNTATFKNGGCYVFTDRGTYEYLETTAAIKNLQIMTRDNDPAAPGGITALVNSFHGYILNATKMAGLNYTVNTEGATDLFNWIVSPAGQQAIGNYLNNGYSGGAAFLPDAAPTLTASDLPASVKPGQKVTVTGTLANVVPGTPALDGVQVSLLGVSASGTTSVAGSATTDSKGDYSITFTPSQTMTYSVESPAITKIENSDLTPVFGDLLQPTSIPLTKVTVGSAVSISKATVKKTKLTVKGTLSPAAPADAYLSFLKGKSKPAASGLSTVALKPGAKTFSFTTTLPKGTWKIQVRYAAGGAVVASTSKAKTVKIK